LKLWNEDLASNRPALNDTLFFEGLVVEEDGQLRISVSLARCIRSPQPLLLEKRVKRSFKPVDWKAFQEIEEGTRVRVRGVILWRDAGGFHLLIGEGMDRVVDVVLQRVSSPKNYRIGDEVLVEGDRLRNQDPEGHQDRPAVVKAYIKKTRVPQD
jgi:hypothetical protein